MSPQGAALRNQPCFENRSLISFRVPITIYSVVQNPHYVRLRRTTRGKLVKNVAICWNIPCIPYAARYGVGTISRKPGFVRLCFSEPRLRRGLLRDLTPRARHFSKEECGVMIKSDLHGDMEAQNRSAVITSVARKSRYVRPGFDRGLGSPPREIQELIRL